MRSTKPARTHEPQHDAHCDLFDENLWRNWEASQGSDDPQLQAAIDMPPVFEGYVIASSESIEPRYWRRRESGDAPGRWVPLDQASVFTRDDVTRVGSDLIVDGFWMSLERAHELNEH